MSKRDPKGLMISLVYGNDSVCGNSVGNCHKAGLRL